MIADAPARPSRSSRARREPAGARLRRAGTFAWQALGIVALLLVAGWAAGRLMPVLLPLGIAILLSALLGPIERRLEHAGLAPAAATLATLGALILLVGALLMLVVPPFVSRLGDLGASLESGLREVAYTAGHDGLGMDRAAVDAAIERALDNLRAHAGGLAGDAVSGAWALVSALAAGALAIFMSFFILKDGRQIWAFVIGLGPQHRRSGARELGRRIWQVLETYSRGVVFVATVDAVLIGAVLLVVGVPLAIPLIVLTWLGAFFPIVGALAAGAAAVLVTLVSLGLGPALVVLGAIIAVQQLEGNVLYPAVVGPRLRLHPVVVLLAVALGGTIAGLAGAFLAVPVATVAATALEFAREREDGT